jgi:protein-L-isoaspartate(D-aspartate) O-methyltransferase
MDEIQERQQALVDQLKEQNCITTPVVEQAFLSVPRHLFLPGEPLDKVYADRSVVVRQDDEGNWTSSSSQPAIMAIMLEQLDLKPGQRVLEIGSGTGFNAALIASIVGTSGAVVTVDIQPDLVQGAREALDRAGYGWVQALAGDGGYGYPEGAPYDRIILSVASSVIAPAWREQLAPGGRLVLPLALPGGQQSVAFERRGQELVSLSASRCGFMGLQGDLRAAPVAEIQIGPDPSLRLFLAFDGERGLPTSAEQFAAWLSEPGRDWATGVETTLPEIWHSFFPWASLQGAQGGERTDLRAGLAARGDLADQEIISALWGLAGERKGAYTFAWIEADGAAAMTWPAGQPLPVVDDQHSSDAALKVYVRQLGPGHHAAQRLVESIQEWDHAGRPEPKWQIRALCAEMAYTPREGEFLLDRKWTKLVIRYQLSERGA